MRDAELEARLKAHGFRVVLVSANELSERYQVLAAPLLIVAAPDGSIRYSGGYTRRKQGPDPEDLEIINSLRRERSVDTLPILGCAVSEKLRAALNPLRLP
jgi:hypothetical protein